MKLNKKRRIVLTSIATGGAVLPVLPKNWTKPVIDTVLVPAHAQTSDVSTGGSGSSATCIPCTQSTFTAVPAGISVQPVGGVPSTVGSEGSFSVSVCVDNSTSQVLMVGTGNQGFGGGLEFDESMTITVSRPGFPSATESFSSFQSACSGGATNVPAGSANFDISSLFRDGGGDFICANHNVSGVQCNANGRWAIRSFDIVVN